MYCIQQCPQGGATALRKFASFFDLSEALDGLSRAFAYTEQDYLTKSQGGNLAKTVLPSKVLLFRFTTA